MFRLLHQSHCLCCGECVGRDGVIVVSRRELVAVELQAVRDCLKLFPCEFTNFTATSIANFQRNVTCHRQVKRDAGTVQYRLREILVLGVTLNRQERVTDYRRQYWDAGTVSLFATADGSDLCLFDCNFVNRRSRFGRCYDN